MPPLPDARNHFIEAILLDMGGTLDGRGAWRDRFHRLFAELGLERFSHAERTRAFDYADERSHTTPEMGTARLRSMLDQHVAWQLESLGLHDPMIQREIVGRFAAEAEEAASVNRDVLATLVEQGFRLGVVSNACGNAAVLCEEFGYSAMLSAIVDSQRVGVSKPDPAIFRHALALVRTAPERAAFVGDSLDRDIEPAKRLGMVTFWIASRPAQRTEQNALADVTLDSVADLPARLQQFGPRNTFITSGRDQGL